MGEPIFDLSNSQNWDFLGNYQKSAEYSSSGRYYYPLGTVIFPVQVASNIFCIRVDTVGRRKTWFSAGLLDIKVITSFDQDVVIPDTSIYSREGLWLSEFRVIRVDRLATSLGLYFLAQPWLEAIDVYVWRYIGEQGDTDDAKFANIQASLDRIEAKLNGT